MAYTFVRNQKVGRHTKRFVRSQTTNHILTASGFAAGLEDNVSNLVGGTSPNDPHKFAPHDWHPSDLAQAYLS